MKIRHGFVSNSSSSSFICFGVRVSGSDVEELMEETEFEELTDEYGADYYYAGEEGNFYFGEYNLHDSNDPIEMTNVLKEGLKPGETLTDAEKRIKAAAKEVLKVDEKDMEFGLFVGTIPT